MSIILSWIGIIFHTHILGNSLISWISSLILIIFMLIFALFRQDSNYIKFVFLPISVISASSYDFYSGGTFATGFFQYLSLDLFCILVFLFRYIFRTLNLDKSIKLVDFLLILLVIMCTASGILGYFLHFKNFTWVLYVPISFIIFCYIGELRVKGILTNTEEYSKILILIILTSWFVLGLINFTHIMFAITILFYYFLLGLNFKTLSFLTLAVFTLYLIVLLTKLSLISSFTTLLFLLTFLSCLLIPFTIHFFFKLLIFVGGFIPAFIIIFSTKLPEVISDYRSQTFIQFFDKYELLLYKLYDDRLALWYGALNKINEKSFLHNLVRPSGETFLPSLSRIFHSDFFSEPHKLEWSGLSHSGFIEIYFQTGLIGGVIYFFLIFKTFSKDFGSVRSTNYLQVSILILLFIGNFMLTKSMILLWIFLGLFVKENVYTDVSKNN